MKKETGQIALCPFVFSNTYKAKFPCQRPRGHEGAHSLSRYRGDNVDGRGEAEKEK